jgi:alkylhydroperoxidase/carboxymuconolactone decarboxylase family protein YurZ
MMMLDWNAYQQQLMANIGQIGKLSPDTVRGYREMGEAGNKTAHLDAKTRELIALAVAVTRQCDGCIPCIPAPRCSRVRRARRSPKRWA